jgi:hypothetical protein
MVPMVFCAHLLDTTSISAVHNAIKTEQIVGKVITIVGINTDNFIYFPKNKRPKIRAFLFYTMERRRLIRSSTGGCVLNKPLTFFKGL